MSKRAKTFPLALSRAQTQTPAYRWLYSALRDQILKGYLRQGARLPATRDLAGQYSLSRGTIVRAFEELKAEGYIEGNTGSGTYVSRVLPDELLAARKTKRNDDMAQANVGRNLSNYARRITPFENFENRPSRAFRANLPALDLFPAQPWAQIAARRLRKVSVSQLLVCDALGYLPLRRAVADYLTASRGVKCFPEQIAIVAGMQHALDLAARLFIDPGDRVCVENPGYPGAANAFEAAGAKIVPIGLDAEGMKLDEKNLAGTKLIYATPGHQFPLGISMSLARRLQFLQWAQQTGAMIFEDDYDSEYRYSGRPLPALQGLATRGVVLFAGSFSKVLFPSLRLGYMVLPSDLIERFSALISISSRHAPLLEQAVLCDFITEGHFGRHLRRMRQIYAERLSILLEAASLRLGGLLEVSNVQAGLQTVARLGGGLNPESVAAAAAKRGVEVTPIDRYSRGKGISGGLQLGFAAFDGREIRRGVRELAIALEGEA